MDALAHLLDTSLSHLYEPVPAARLEFASGRLIRLRRGFYVPTPVWLDAGPHERFSLALEAYARANPGTVFCGETALFIRGLPTVKAPPTIDVATSSNGRLGLQPTTFAVRGTSDDAARARLAPPPSVRRHLHHSGAAEEVGEYDTVPLEEALVEVLASEKFARALTVADGVLRKVPGVPLLERPGVTGRISGLAARSRRRRAELVASLARPGAESPGESVSRALMHLFGFPEPALQREHYDSMGFIGRTDFFWDVAPQPVGEFDGWESTSGPS